MKHTILVILLLLMTVSGEQTTRAVIHLEKTQFGNYSSGTENAGYRIIILTDNTIPVLYPDKLDGTLDIEIYSLSVELNIIIEINLEITTPKNNGYTGYNLNFLILNSSLGKGEQIFDVEEMDHYSGVRVDLGNGTFYPISSYYYLDQNNARVDSEINIFLEQSNHSISWNTDVELSLSFEFNSIQYQLNNTSDTVEAKEERIYIGITFYSVFILLVLTNKYRQIIK